MNYKVTYKITKWHPTNEKHLTTVVLNCCGTIDGEILFSSHNINVNEYSTKNEIIDGFKSFLLRLSFVLNVEVISCEEFE